MSNVPEIDIEGLEAALAAGARLLDVREDHEWLAERVAGGLHIPLGDVPSRAGEISGDGPLYVICAAGGRSLTAADFLRAAGHETVNVAGGTNAWVAAGKPTVSGPAE